MAETTAQIFSQPKPRKNPASPLKLFRTIFCQHCDQQCNPAEARFQNCVLTFLADELTRIRQLLQHRTQHNSW